jgi:hypothetical protein
MACSSAEAGGQYVHQLLSNASPEQWECAMTWRKDEWGTYFCQLVMHIFLLMEMIRTASGSPAMGLTAAAAPSTAVGASTPPDLGGSCTISGDEIVSAAQAIAAAAPAGTLAAETNSLVSSLLEHLEQLVDDFVCKICLSLSYNNMGVREASVINYSNHELVEDIPPEHWQQVRFRRRAEAC